MNNPTINTPAIALFASLLGTNDHPSTPTTRNLVASSIKLARRTWHVLPEIYPRLRSWVGNCFANSDMRRLEALSYVVKSFAQAQLGAISGITSALNASTTQHVYLKGTATRFDAYKSPDLRCGFDIDIGVKPREVNSAVAALLGAGYHRAMWSWRSLRFHRVDPIRHSIASWHHHEVGYLTKRIALPNQSQLSTAIDLTGDWLPIGTLHRLSDGRIGCYITLDVHFAVSQDQPLTSMLAKSRHLAWGNLRLPLPPRSSLMAHLIYKIYHEGCHKYRSEIVHQYADLCRLFRISNDSERSALLDELKRRKLGAAGFYVLRRLPSEFATSLDTRTQDFLSSESNAPIDASPAQVGDFGDMWPKIWGFR